METVLKVKDSKHIMVVEDDVSLAGWICDFLISKGFTVTLATRGDEAVDLIITDNPDLVLLDVILPGKSGFDVCREIRNTYSRPILILTACTEDKDEVTGLDLGADDYLAKPVRPHVLLARINALLRRDTGQVVETIIEFGGLSIDSDSKTVNLDGTVVRISAKEFDVLWILAKNAGSVLSRGDLINQLRGLDYDGFDRSVDMCISRLRKKLNDNSAQPFRIKTLRSKGYLFATDAW